MRVFQRIGQYGHDAEFATWLYRMTANAYTDEFRRRKRCANWNEVMASGCDDEEFTRIELSAAVQAAL